MKVTELMIGDYIKYQEHIYIIEEISAQGWIHLIYPETKTRLNLTSDYIIDLLEPVLLTSETLEKNGFYYDKNRRAYLMGVILQIKPDKNGLFYYEICKCIHSLNTVHQLQHLLKLRGLNDLANNLKLEE